MSVIEREPQIPVVLALCDVYETERNATWPAPTSQHFGTGIWNGPDLLKEYLMGNIFTVMCSIMIRTDMLRAKGGFRTDMYAADMAAWAAMLLEGNAGLVNESCAVFCRHKSALTYALPIDEHIEDERRMMDAINDVAGFLETSKKRRNVTLFARRYFARSIVGILFAPRTRCWPDEGIAPGNLAMAT